MEDQDRAGEEDEEDQGRPPPLSSTFLCLCIFCSNQFWVVSNISHLFAIHPSRNVNTTSFLHPWFYFCVVWTTFQNKVNPKWQPRTRLQTRLLLFRSVQHRLQVYERGCYATNAWRTHHCTSWSIWVTFKISLKCGKLLNKYKILLDKLHS